MPTGRCLHGGRPHKDTGSRRRGTPQGPSETPRDTPVRGPVGRLGDTGGVFSEVVLASSLTFCMGAQGEGWGPCPVDWGLRPVKMTDLGLEL